MMIYVFFYLCISIKSMTVLSLNNSAVLISRYSKVAHWGQSSSPVSEITSESRSANGQSFWTHRSDANIVGGQNLKQSKPNVVYHYAVPSKSVRRYGDDVSDSQPAVGEVQERFNAKPYFNYAPAPGPKRQKVQIDNPKPVSPTPFYDASPSVNRPILPKTPPTDSYNSPYSSYNPQVVNDNGGKDDTPVYPPIDQAPPGDSDNVQVQAPDDTSSGYSYTPPPDASNIYYDDAKKSKPMKEEKKPEVSPYGSLPPFNTGSNHGDDHMFYSPPQSDDNEVILDHPPPGYGDSGHDSNSMDNMADHNNGGMPVVPDMAEGDLNPPPSDDFPQYLHNGPSDSSGHDFGDYDFDPHHAYHVVEHTTTPAPPHDERVNKGHYSYYYLGRKLWYIPLYFSVYFIIYVTVLILKSIARHKINLKHDLHDKFSRESRQMPLTEHVNELYKNVTEGINTMSQKYMM